MGRAEYASISEGLADALDFTRTIGLDSGREAQSYERGGGRGVLGEADLFTRYIVLLTERLLLTLHQPRRTLTPLRGSYDSEIPHTRFDRFPRTRDTDT